LVERIVRGSERAVAYYRLSAKGKSVLLAASRQKLLAQQEAARLAYEREVELRRQKLEEEAIAGRARLLKDQAGDRRRLPRSIDVRDWPDFPGWQD
jgi:DNA-binding PadR family transcriptional regulator